MMNTESVLSRVHDALSFLPNNVRMTSEILTTLCDTLSVALRSEVAADRRVLSPTRKAESLIKAFRRTDSREALQYPWTDAEGRQCWTNDFLAFRFNAPLPLESRPDDAPPVKPLDLSRIFPASLSGYLTADLPSRADLRSFIALERAEHGSKTVPVYDLGPRCPLVNAVYLLDIMTLFPEARQIHFKDLTSPLYLSADSGDGLLMPCLPTDEKRAEMTASEPSEAYSHPSEASSEPSEPSATPSQPSEASSESSEPSASPSDPEKHLSEFVSPDSVTSQWHFGPSSLTIDGHSYPSEHSVTPSGAIVVFWQQDGVSRRLRIPASHPLNAVVYAALHAPSESSSEAPSETPSAPSKAPLAFEPAPVCLPAPAPVFLLPAPKAPHAFEPAPVRSVPEKFFVGTQLTGNGWRIFFNPDLERTQVILTAPTRLLTDAVVAAGFFYSPRTGSYNKKLTFKAYRAAQALARTLGELSA